MTAIEKRNLPAEPIVVADDDPAQLEEISDYLRRRGHDVVEARDGFSALAAIKKYQPRIALIDVNMPNWDGVRVAEVASSFGNYILDVADSPLHARDREPAGTDTTAEVDGERA
ncbi:MAG: response regulator [Alphaproteobacteria bacterium]